MNRLSYRVVFNAKRGQLVAVAESATSQGKSCGERPSRTGSGCSRQGSLALLRCGSVSAIAFAAFLAMQPSAFAQIIADTTAPANQRPTVLSGVMVNIQTPSAAGVSRNTYSRFDMGASDTVILNNNRFSNPWLATGSARVILNEVRSSNPSNLAGQLLVEGVPPGGGRADVVFANPSGINVNGLSVFGAGRFTLTTGAPVINAGALTGFDITRGSIQVSGGLGLTSPGTYAELLSRSVVIGGNVIANQAVNIVTGSQTVDYATGTITPLTGAGAAPALAIDTKAWGGMYAGSITMLSTEAGVGVRNDGTLQANTGSGQLIVTADGRLQNTGRMDAAYTSVATVAADIDNSGNLLGRKLLMASAGANFNQVGTGMAQNEAATSPLSDPWHTAYNIGAGMAQDAGSASQVFINAKQDVNVAAGARIASNGRVTATDGTLIKGQVVVSAGRNVNLPTGSNLSANGAVQLNSDGVVNGTMNTVSSATGDATILAKQGITLSNSTVTGDKVHLETGAAFEETSSSVSISGGQINGAQHTALIASGDIWVDSPDAASVRSAGNVFLQAGKNLAFTGGTNSTAGNNFTAIAGNALELRGIAGATADVGKKVQITSGGDAALSGGSVFLHGSAIRSGGAIQIDSDKSSILLQALSDQSQSTHSSVMLNAGGDLAISAYEDGISTKALQATGQNVYVVSNGATVIDRVENPAGQPLQLQSSIYARGDLTVGSIHNEGVVDLIGSTLQAEGQVKVIAEGKVNLENSFTYRQLNGVWQFGMSRSTLWGGSVSIRGGEIVTRGAQIYAGRGSADLVSSAGQISLGYRGFDATAIVAGNNVLVHANSGLNISSALLNASENLALTSAAGGIATTHASLRAKEVLSISSKGSQSHVNGVFLGGAVSLFNESSSLNLQNSNLRASPDATNRVLPVRGALSIESGGTIVADSGTKFDAGADLFVVANAGDITIAPDRTALNNSGLVLTQNQLQAGKDVNIAARSGVLKVVGAAGGAGNPTAKTVTLASKRDLNLMGAAVELQAPNLSAARDVNITSYSGAVLVDGIKSNFTAYVPQARVNDLVAERTHYETLMAQEQARPNPNLAYIAEMKAERDALAPVISALSAQAKGGEHLGATITGRNVNITSAAGMAIYGAEITGTGTVNLSSSGVLPIDTTASVELQKPSGTVIAGLSDFYEYGAAGTSAHKFVLMSKPTIISGQAGVSIKAVGNDANARLVLNDSAVRSASGTVALQSLGDMRLEAGQEEFYSRSINTYTRKSWGGLRKKRITEITTKQSVTASPVVLEAQNIAIKSGGSIDAFATEFLAPQGNIQITAANALNLRAVDEVNINNFNSSSRSSFLGITYSKGSTANSRTVSEQLPSRLVASGASTASGWNTLLQGTVFQTNLSGANITAGVGPNARADAQIILEGIKKTVTESRTKESNYVVWQRQLGSGSTVETMTLPSFTGPQRPVFNAPGGISVQIPAGELTGQIQTLSQQPGMGYLTELSQRRDVNWQPVKLAYDQWSYKQEGLTPAGAALLGAAVAWATGGMGADLLGQAFGTNLTGASAMAANAAFTSLAAQASITLVNNKGNIGKTLSDLAKSDIVKATLAAALTAGVLDKIGALEGMQGLKDSTQFADKLTYNLVNAGGRALTNTAINGGDLEDALKQALVSGLVDTAHGKVASQIKVLEGEYLAHKLAHALAGCVAGAAAGGECRDGAIGAAVGEIIAGPGGLLKPKNGMFYTDAEKQNVLAVAKLVGGAVSAYAGGDAQTAITTAETAVSNNAFFVPVLVALLMGGGYSTYVGDGNALTGLQQIGQGNDPLSKAMLNGATAVVDMSMQRFPAETTATLNFLNSVAEPVGQAVNATVTYMDDATGRVVSTQWNNLSPATRDALIGAGKITSVAISAGGVSTIRTALTRPRGVDWSPSISIRGASWETFLSDGKFKDYVALNELQSNHKAFDFFDPDTGHAVSAKTMDTLGLTSKEGTPMTAANAERYLTGYIKDARDYEKSRTQPNAISETRITSKSVELAIPNGTPSDVRQALERAAAYGRAEGVQVRITVVRK